ncbi:MAG TPA: DUF4384 domain-containing protein, partial [Bryobacteraceae bacterium]|nr:DUF4384 domain-containing protein [Bryobacteraceae bacterium]
SPMKHLLVLTILASVVAPGVVWSQGQPVLKARELFYTPPPDAAKPVADTKAAPAKKVAAKAATPKADTHTVTASVPLGLRYAVLKRDASGQYQEVDPDTNFRSGDRIRLHVDANTSGYLYVVMQGSSGTWKLLFPSAEVAGGSNLVRKGESRQIPSGDRGQFVFDEQAGNEKLFIVLTRQPEPDLDKLIYSMGGKPGDAKDRSLVAQASVGDNVVSRLRSQVASRDLVFEKVDSPSADGKLENAAYVVNPSTAPDARLVVDVALKHK